MDATPVLMCAVAFLMMHSVLGVTNPYIPRCSMTERSYLFNQCLMAFGWSHWNDRAAMQNSSTCLRQKLQCPAAETAVNCINKIAANRLNANCWKGMTETLSYMLLDYNFGCTYYDIEIKCGNTVPQIISKARG